MMKHFCVCLTDSSPPSIMKSFVGFSFPGPSYLLFSWFSLTSDDMIGGTFDVSGVVFFLEGCWS